MNSKQYFGYTMTALIIITITATTGWYLFEKFDQDYMQDTSVNKFMNVYRSGPFQIGIRINPEAPVVGKNLLTLRIQDTKGKLVSGAEVQAFGQMAAMGAMPTMRAPAELEEASPGIYEGPFTLEMTGTWPLTVNINKPGVGDTHMNFDMATGRTGLQIASGGTPVSSMQNKEISGMQDISMPRQDVNGVIHTGNYQVMVNLDQKEPQVGTNRLTVQVGDKNGNTVTGARLRAVVQLQNAQAMAEIMSGSGMKNKRTAISIEMKEEVPGKFVGCFELPGESQWALAVDIEKEGLGHADLVFDIVTEGKGLQLATMTPEGIAYYTCSMHTSVRAAAPGQCPICSMDLVPVSKEEVTTGTITVDNRRRQLIGLETGEVKERHLISSIRAVGEVTYDETRLSDVSLRFDAWVGELKANYVGKKVKRGDMLFSVYGPELLAAQQEYLELLKRRQGQMNSLITAARKRLLLWDMTPDQIKQLEERGEPLDYVPIMAPRSGTVIKKDVVIGTANKAGTTLMRIADLSRVWVEADVYESELDLIKPGMDAEVTLPYMPNQTYLAKVDYIYPYLMGATRTGRIRLVIDNDNGKLKPDMYAEVRLKADLGQRLSVPEEAVLYAGDSRVVFVDLGNGKLKPKKIKVGVRTRDYIEVLEGLSLGEKVVTSGNFLIAAESRIKSGIQQW